MPFSDPVIAWKTYEYIPHERGINWNILMGTATLSMVIYGIVTESITMAIVFLLLAGVYKLVHSEEPKIINVAISELGVKYGNEIILFNQIEAFWIVYNESIVQVHFLVKNRFPRDLTIYLSAQDPRVLRMFLLKHVPEYEGRSERRIDKFARIFRL